MLAVLVVTLSLWMTLKYDSILMLNFVDFSCKFLQPVNVSSSIIVQSGIVISIRFSHPSKHPKIPDLITLIETGKLILVSASHWWNVPRCKVNNCFVSNLTEFKRLHLSKAHAPIWLTLVGMITDFKLRHTSNEPTPIDFTFSGIVISDRLLQLQKRQEEIVVKFSESVIDWRRLQRQKHSTPRDLIEFGKIIL